MLASGSVVIAVTMVGASVVGAAVTMDLCSLGDKDKQAFRTSGTGRQLLC